VSADVTFFESFSYFSTQVLFTVSEIIPPSLSVLLPTPADTASLLVPSAETTDPYASKPVQDFRYVYTHHLKVLTSESVLANLSRLTVLFLHHQLLLLILIFILLFEKEKQSCTVHPISNFVSYDHLNPTFWQFTLFVFWAYTQILYRDFISICLKTCNGWGDENSYF